MTSRSPGAAPDSPLARSVVRVQPAPHPPPDPLAARWFPSPEALATELAAGRGASVTEWFGFSRRWPVVADGDELLAPGLPGPVTAAGNDGPDGGYRLAGPLVLREARGREAVLLRRDPGETEAALDLLWFDDLTRWVVRSGTLEGEDRLCRLRLGATRERLERLLVRGLRVEASVLAGLDDAPAGVATLEVRRAEALVGSAWRDPAAVLAAAAGVVRVVAAGNRLEVHREPDRRERLELVPARRGWRAERREGVSPVAALSMHLEDGDVVARAELDPGLDPLGPGVRGRLAFDLLSDLVVLGGGPRRR